LTTSEFVNAVYLTAAGKLPTFVSGSTKWLKIVAIANNKIDVWQNENGANWNSLYDPSYSLGTVSATKTYELDDEIRSLSDTSVDAIEIAHLDGTSSYWHTVEANKLKQYPTGNYCAQVGRTLVFNRAFTATDAEFGGTIYAPIYLYAEHLSGDNDEVPVDDPQWLVLMVSAEYVRNDIVKQNQYPNLVNEANSLMEAMRTRNEAQIDTVDRPWRPLSQEW
jgi:hypothetical protein